jgi:hypothetical protein
MNKEDDKNNLKKSNTNSNIQSELIYFFKNLYYDKLNINHSDLPFEFKLNKYSSINNIIKYIFIQELEYLVNTNTVYINLKINRNNSIINYANILSTLENKNLKNNLIYQYIICSSSLLSKDGEYKHNLIKFDTLNSNSNSNVFNNVIIHDIYEYIMNNINNNEFSLSYEIYNIDTNIKNNETKQLLINDIILIKVYIISWFIEIYNKEFNLQNININEYYNSIMFSNKDTKFFKDNILKKYNFNDLELLHNQLTYIINDDIIKLELGQKIIPFNYIQLKEYKHIIHFQWKELLINKIILNILYNYNSPCFSLYGKWVLINNINKNMFNNDEIYNKLDYSVRIKFLLKHMYIIKNNLLEMSDTSSDFKYNTTSLLNKIKLAINESETKLLMSNIALCYISEYSGKTLFDYLNKSIDPKFISPNIGNLYKDYNIFSKYIFEIIYSLYCLNLKGIIHGDLHLNNITLNCSSSNNHNSNNSNNSNNNSHILYNLDYEINNNIIDYINGVYKFNEKNKKITTNESYIFNNTNCNPCIIDYSRSYILLKLIKENIIEKDKNKIRNKFITHERNRIIKELYKIFPNYIKNNIHKIKFLFKNKNFDILFIYFTAYDTFTFITNLLLLLNKLSAYNNIEVNPKIIDLLTNISKKSYSYLENIINEDKYYENIKYQFPNYLIIKEFFQEFKFNNINSDLNIINIFNLNNIELHQNKNEIRKEIKNYIINNDKKQSNIEIIKYFKKFLDLEGINNDIEVERIINKEYYNIKCDFIDKTIDEDSYLDSTLDSSLDSTLNNALDKSLDKLM